MRFIQISSVVAIAFATMVAAAPVPPSHVLKSNDVSLQTLLHTPQLHEAVEAPVALVKRGGRGAPKGHKGGKKKSCGRDNSIWKEISQASRFGDPRETRGARLAAGIGSLIEWAQGKYKGC